jgi:hypothetical protein
MPRPSTQPIAPHHGDTILYQFDPLTGFWGRPGVECQYKFDQCPESIKTVRHNEAGLRDQPYVEQNEKPKVVCIGGSHTWGGGVDQEARYTDFLARQTGWQVVNMGQCSLGLDQICLAVLEKTRRYNPSVIVLEQYPWAVHRVLNNYVNGYVKPYFSVSARGDLKLHKLPRAARYPMLRKWVGAYYNFRKELREFRGGIDLKRTYNPMTDPIFLAWKAHYYNAMYALVEKILGVIASDCRQRNIHLLVALGTVMQDLPGTSPSALVDYALPRRRMIQLLEKGHMPYVDMTDAMRAHHTPDSPVIFPDGHINEKGHQVFAEVVANEIKRRGWLRVS